MKFVDEATLFVEAGKGGDGSRSFRREKYIPFGGPDGGDGGHGGSIYLVGCADINTLVDFRYVRRIKAQGGDCGHGRQCYGKCGQDEAIRVPVGTMVYDDDTQELLGDLVKDGQKLLVAKGGRGGLGNIHFKSSTNRAPRTCTPGKPGEARHLRLELKLLADVGLLGLPNAGKSTFLRAISAAKPKVADYPFTTLHPGLGTVRLGKGSSFVVADIPGIIEGAHLGAGLGLQFLRHLSRTKLLLHCVDVSDLADKPPVEAIELITKELQSFAPQLANKTRWLVLNKADTLAEEDMLALKQAIEERFQLPAYVISSVAHTGIKPLVNACWEHLKENVKTSESLEEEIVEETL